MPRAPDPPSRPLAVGLVLGGVASVQIGAALATTLFDELGPAGAVLLRIGFGAAVLVAIWRPAFERLLRGDGRRDVLLFGLSLGLMNWSFYEALDRIPLGIAVTLEFVGPLGVAVATSHTRADAVWVTLAAVGILLLSPTPGGSIDALGAAFALGAGACWAAYIVLAARVGRSFAGGTGLALAMVVATLVVLPAGIAAEGDAFDEPSLLATGLAVALLSSAIPYSLELEALRRLPKGTFGVMMSLEPAVAATVGFVGLDQGLSANEVIAIALVVTASAGALRTAPPAVEA